jgi:acyl-CoA reductase-like NAD-dependent aldehyde dehydrogenase
MSELLKIFAPFDNKLIDEIPLANKAEIEKALQTAYDISKDTNKTLPKYERIAILERLVVLMSERVEELALIAAEEGGKPYIDSKIEVDRAINGVKLAISSLYGLRGEEIPMGLTKPSENRMAFTFHEPIGVVVSLSAFNHPLNLIIHQVIPAVAVGCPVIVKPASATPRSAFNLVNLLYEAGLPKEYCKAVVCKNQLSEKLATDPRVNYVSFIGSAEIGWYLRSKLAPGTRIALEHGGAAPVIIDKNVDLHEIIPPLMKGGFYHAGQVCVSVQRIYAHESIARELADRMAELSVRLKVGDPLGKETEVGPLITAKEVNRIEEWINELSKDVILSGGKRLSDSMYAPTVLWNPSSESKVSTHEIFGPVVNIISYNDSSEALNMANSLRLAFQASVFTKSLDFSMEMVKKLNASAVMVNDHTAFRVDWMPFGGREASGLGWGGIPQSMHEMTRAKLMVIKSSML